MLAVGNTLFVILLLVLVGETSSTDTEGARKWMTSWLRKLGVRGSLDNYFSSNDPMFGVLFKDWDQQNKEKRVNPPNSLHMKWVWNEDSADAVREATQKNLYDWFYILLVLCWWKCYDAPYICSYLRAHWTDSKKTPNKDGWHLETQTDQVS